MPAGEPTSQTPLMALPRVRSNRYHSLDLWRGIACLMVAIYHSSFYLTADPMPRRHDRVSDAVFQLVEVMWIGVPVFFVISGYCISAACDNLRERGFGVKRYFARRFRRIFPPYWAAVGVALLISLAFRWSLHGGEVTTWVHPEPNPFHLRILEKLGLYTLWIHSMPNPFHLTWGQWLGNLTLTETWRYHLAGNIGSYFDKFYLGQGWSLCYEEQFYAICGLALLIAPRRFFQIMLGITIAVVAITTANSLAIRYGGRGPLIGSEGFFWDGRWLTFGAGVLVYYRLNYARESRRQLVNAILAVLLVVALARCLWENGGLVVHDGRHHHFSATVWDSLWNGPRIWAELWPGLIFAMLIVAAHRWDLALAQSPLLRPLMFCGKISYSLYLVHWPMVKVISMLFYWRGFRGPWKTLLVVDPICLAAAILAGWLFYQAVERRFLNPPVKVADHPGPLGGALSNAEVPAKSPEIIVTD